jgi:hypothetical protein
VRDERGRHCAPTRREHECSLQEGARYPDLADWIVARIVELAKGGIYDIEELSSRTLSSLKAEG